MSAPDLQTLFHFEDAIEKNQEMFLGSRTIQVDCRVKTQRLLAKLMAD